MTLYIATKIRDQYPHRGTHSGGLRKADTRQKTLSPRAAESELLDTTSNENPKAAIRDYSAEQQRVILEDIRIPSSPG